MTKCSSLLLLIICVIPCYIYSQVPGYQGKKISIEYQNYFGPAIFNPNTNGGKGITSFNSRHSFGLDYVITRSISFGIAYHYYKTNFELITSFPLVYENSLGTYRVSMNNLDEFQPVGTLNGNALSLSCKFFTGDYLAPLGKYIKLEFIHHFYNTEIEDEVMDETFNVDLQVPEVNFNTNSNYSVSGFGLIFGSQRIVFDRVILNSSIQFGLLLKGWRGNKLLSINETETNQDTYFGYITRARLFSHYAVNFNLGIGFLVK